ncbi:MAG: hypothetical protein VKJ02_09850 [Snowella sp.]|nr:hypothetical protein [Snowella sp.]
MVNREVERFSIHFGFLYGLLSSIVLLPPHNCYVEVDRQWIRVQMGWAFRTQFPQSAIRGVRLTNYAPWSRGVHGWGNRWLVNGSGQNIVCVELQTPQRAYVIGFPIRLETLLISVTEPRNFIALINSHSGDNLSG